MTSATRRLAFALFAGCVFAVGIGAQDAGEDKSESGEEAGAAPSRLDKRNQEAADRVYKTVAARHGRITNLARGLKKEDVIVVGGLFDFMQEILTAFRIPHTVISCAELDAHTFDPSRQILFLNCHRIDRKFPASNRRYKRPSPAEAAARLAREIKAAGLDEKGAPGEAIRNRFDDVKYFAETDYSVSALKRLGRFVKDGGWVMSTDWALLAVEKALPKTVKWTGRVTYEERIEVRPSASGKREPLMKDVFPKKKARWWIETEGYLFVVKSRRGKVLVESRGLAARYHGNKNVVALVEVGKGRLLHALSHGFLQAGATDDLTAMQMLVANFLVARSIQVHRADLAAAAEEK